MDWVEDTAHCLAQPPQQIATCNCNHWWSLRCLVYQISLSHFLSYPELQNCSLQRFAEFSGTTTRPVPLRRRWCITTNHRPLFRPTTIPTTTPAGFNIVKVLTSAFADYCDRWQRTCKLAGVSSCCLSPVSSVASASYLLLS